MRLTLLGSTGPEGLDEFIASYQGKTDRAR